METGWRFPPTFNYHSGVLISNSEEEDILESLQILLSTRKGERNMLPDYGCDLHLMTFENENEIFYLQNIIRNAIEEFELRITLENIEVNTEKKSGGLITILIFFSINKTNKSSSIALEHRITI